MYYRYFFQGPSRTPLLQALHLTNSLVNPPTLSIQDHHLLVPAPLPAPPPELPTTSSHSHSSHPPTHQHARCPPPTHRPPARPCPALGWEGEPAAEKGYADAERKRRAEKPISYGGSERRGGPGMSDMFP
ncbi:hypothetical protein P167DRAFT_256133 [Morchella conica CCBAS932]|uniref:Uncharacterized protein n=1 Tax=Morchella conica CCBAS932 TaxID=1392247 RepID=A0A3N4KIX7_9PEZI|nr:hypothetical protein P167DRAFT_256133 [Morchella conica CCBAS932]